MTDRDATTDPADVAAFVAAIADPTRRAEAGILLELMGRASAARPAIWQGRMIGFGAYDYRYDSGRTGRWFLTGFTPGKARLSIYVMPGFDDFADQLARLGPHRTGVSCLYVTRLERIDLDVLEEIVAASVVQMRARYTVVEEEAT